MTVVSYFTYVSETRSGVRGLMIGKYLVECHHESDDLARDILELLRVDRQTRQATVLHACPVTREEYRVLQHPNQPNRASQASEGLALDSGSCADVECFVARVL